MHPVWVDGEAIDRRERGARRRREVAIQILDHRVAPQVEQSSEAVRPARREGRVRREEGQVADAAAAVARGLAAEVAVRGQVRCALAAPDSDGSVVSSGCCEARQLFNAVVVSRRRLTKFGNAYLTVRHRGMRV